MDECVLDIICTMHIHPLPCDLKDIYNIMISFPTINAPANGFPAINQSAKRLLKATTRANIATVVFYISTRCAVRSVQARTKGALRSWTTENDVVIEWIDTNDSGLECRLTAVGHHAQFFARVSCYKFILSRKGIHHLCAQHGIALDKKDTQVALRPLFMGRNLDLNHDFWCVCGG